MDGSTLSQKSYNEMLILDLMLIFDAGSFVLCHEVYEHISLVGGSLSCAIRYPGIAFFMSFCYSQDYNFWGRRRKHVCKNSFLTKLTMSMVGCFFSTVHDREQILPSTNLSHYSTAESPQSMGFGPCSTFTPYGLTMFGCASTWKYIQP